MSPLPPSRSARRWHWLARASGLMMWLLVAAWLVFAATWLLIHGWIVPRIGELRPRLEVAASQALGVPVRIGQITAQSTGLIPSFELRDVTLLDAESRVAVRLPRLVGTLSPTSLWGLGFEQLRAIKPDIIMLSTCNLGQTGPYATQPGFGIQLAGYAGFSHLTG